MDYIQGNLFEETETAGRRPVTRRNTEKAWYIGLPCKELWYFDLLQQGLDIEDCSKPWEIEDYIKNTKYE